MPIRISGSTGISGLDGSATTPVLQGASANSGIYYSGNTVFVSTSGTKALTIGPTGNVAFANSSVSIGGQTISAYSGMMKNRVINGDFRIDQRFAGAANNQISSPQYVVDRWWNSGQVAGKLRFQRNNTNGPGSSATQNATGFPYYFGANVVSSNTVNAGDLYRLSHVIEGFNVSDLGWGTANAAPVTLSFWSYSSVAGPHSVSIINGDGTRSYPFLYNINTANTWQYQTITVPGDTSGTWLTDNGIGIYLFYDLGYGTNWQQSSGSWYSGNYQCANGSVKIVNNANGSFYLTGVQLEKGSQATAWEFRQYGTELALCQRYFSSSYTGQTIPNAGAGGGTIGVAVNTQVLAHIQYFPVQMRTSPVVFQGENGSSGSLYYIATGAHVSFPTNNTPTNPSWFQNFSSSSTTVVAGQGYCWHWWASAELAIQN